MLRLNDQVSNGLGTVMSTTDKARVGFVNAQSEIDNFGKAGTQALREVAGQIPGLNSALTMLSSPLGAAGIGIGVVTAGLYKGVQAAKEFDSQFLELRQLNLDKPREEMDSLNDRILEMSMRMGSNATATAKAFYDVQSATGRYGDEVAKIVEQTTLFSQVTKADLDASITGAAKAINAFGLSADQMEGYFASSAKTVQVGITTFKELAEVQTDYAGAAAAANQTVDDANKLFAAFTITAKSSREAATLTKTAFQDIAKKSTIDGFTKLGVSIFDTEGRMRSVDAITRDLVPQLKGLNDVQFAQLKEQIGGSEGLRGYLNQVKSMGDQVISAFDAFDATEFGMNDALRNAENDLTLMSTKLNNQINTGFIMLGQQIMPTVLAGTTKVVNSLDSMLSKWNELSEESEFFRMGIGLIGDALTAPFRELEKIYNLGVGLVDIFTEVARPVFSLAEGLTKGYNAVLNMVRESTAWSMGEALFGDVAIYWDTFSEYLTMMKDGISDIWEAFNLALSGDLSGAAAALRGNQGINNPAGTDGAGSPLPSAPGSTGTGGGETDTAALGRGISDISGGGAQTRNITVNIAKMVEAINIHTAEVRGEMGDIQRQIEEAMVRAINGAEMAVSNG